MKKRGIILALAMVVTMGLAGCGVQSVEPVSTTEPSSEEVTSEPQETSSDISVSSDVEEVDWEEPPVPTVYNAKADLNSDGHVDKAEWEKWVAANPADTNKDLVISDAEKEAANPSKPSGGNTQKPAETQKPSGGTNTSKPTNPPATSKPSGGGNTSKPTTPPVTEKPSTPPATEKPSTPSGGAWGDDSVVGPELTQEEKDQFDKNMGQAANPME